MKKKVTNVLALGLVMSTLLVPGVVYGSPKFTPPGLAKKGGLPPGLEKKGGLPPGIEKKIQNSSEDEQKSQVDLKGEIIEITEDSFELKLGNIIVTIQIHEDTLIKIQGEDKSLKDLHIGDFIGFNIDEDKNQIQIEEITCKDIEENIFEGRLTKIQADHDKKITIEMKDEIKTFLVDEDVKVWIDDKEMKFVDLFNEIGKDIKGELKNNKIMEIRVK